ncbi:MAG: hypothetical protein L3J10_01180 [Sulfurimonas sp.]|nr:hypothetical protein [Sulfurimonas sp.]
MTNKFLETLYTKVFINIIVEDSQTVVYIEVCSKSNVIETIQKRFDTTRINAKMYDVIQAYSKQSPFYYISVLDNSSLQGASPAVDKLDMNKYADMSLMKSISFSGWSVYSAEYDLNNISKEYKSIGVDFIFSPFLMMTKFFEDKISTNLSMFILVESNYLTIAIFDNSKLLYAKYADTQYQKDDDLSINIPLDDEYDDVSLDIDGINLEDIDIDDDNSLDDFANIEDLDSGNEIDEFSEAKDIKEIKQDNNDDIGSVDFYEDYQRFLCIQSSLSSFYKDDKYDSKFIESTYIADGIGVSNALKKYLEEEIFLSVYVRKIDLGKELCNMAKAELDAI